MEKKFTHILLIDDKVAENRYNQIVLEQLHITNVIEIAENGEEALDILTGIDRDRPRLIFLDLNMPGMNGWEFLDAYRQAGLHATTKNVIIILTTSMNPEDRAKAAAIPFVTEFYSKPLTPTKFKFILDKYFLNKKD